MTIPAQSLIDSGKITADMASIRTPLLLKVLNGQPVPLPISRWTPNRRPVFFARRAVWNGR